MIFDSFCTRLVFTASFHDHPYPYISPVSIGDVLLRSWPSLSPLLFFLSLFVSTFPLFRSLWLSISLSLSSFLISLPAVLLPLFTFFSFILAGEGDLLVSFRHIFLCN